MFNRFFNYLLVCLSLMLMAGQPANAATPKEPLWPALKVTYFGDKEIRENADDLLVLEAPKRAEDAAIVPVSIKSLVPQTADSYIKNIHFIIDNNPMPYSANFHLSPELGTVDITTRMRIDQYTDIRAIAEMNDGSLHMVSRFVKASGGCSAPAGKDAAAALARLGKMQIRMRQPTVGEPVQAQVIVSHPNYTGLQFDQKARKYIPAHYVKNIDIKYNNQTLLTVEAGISISEDPSIRFSFTPNDHGTLKAVVVDTEEKQFSMEKEI
ncbi:quinoprotein dehydrogenase-associated SoxYZ-like carrier [Methylophaga sp. OBS4]|uniref:quinoprotein dehydrogenase-associated SoxYZ-like carrier n=1 Tax=Methylophaga sp. OBS4 TaxID=2991935 RepID=UPI0022529B84|nr:quinoprotein dehydrogenase-associated SoxYZ-like carrier [Methylophaga sp. OBS4]MCX4188124.1 quinoprotein dehydrogenase-associated SoxYZ-like carrier [Methylophaga sp. OBS4]